MCKIKTESLVTVTLPEPYILSNEILAETLKLYDEDNNIFNPIHMEEIGAEIGDIRAQGEQEAIDNGVFEAARENAEYIIRGFLSGIFDFEVYELRFE